MDFQFTISCTKIDFECMPFPLILCSCFFILIFHIHLNVEKSTVAIEKTITHSGFFYDSIVAIKFLQTL